MVGGVDGGEARGWVFMRVRRGEASGRLKMTRSWERGEEEEGKSGQALGMVAERG